MSKTPHKTNLHLPKDIAVDYALIAIGIAAGLVGLLGLLLV